MKDDNLTQKEIFQMLRDQIEHEDHNIDNRTNWLLVIESFLFISFVSLLTNSNVASADKAIVMIIVCLSGFILSFFAMLGIFAANFHLMDLVKFWEKPDNDQKGEIKKMRKDFPPLLGKGKWIIFNGGFGSLGTTILLMAVWLFLLIYTR